MPLTRQIATAVLTGAVGSLACSAQHTEPVALPDLGTGTYLGIQGGLYPGGTSVRPQPYAAHLRAMADLIAADAAGATIGVISIGMSNTTQHFSSGANLSGDGCACGAPGCDDCDCDDGTLRESAFRFKALEDLSTNASIVFADCAHGGWNLSYWVDNAACIFNDPRQQPAPPCDDPTPPPDLADFVYHRLQSPPMQPDHPQPAIDFEDVQVAWIMHDYAQSAEVPFPEGQLAVADSLEALILDHMVPAFPNLRIVFCTSRTSSFFPGGDENTRGYENGFAFKHLIQRQLAGQPRWSYGTPANDFADGVAPIVTWGPYAWDATSEDAPVRSDQFDWTADHLRQDGFNAHPNDCGVDVLGDGMLAFFKTDPASAAWFLRSQDDLSLQIIPSGTPDYPRTFAPVAITPGLDPDHVSYHWSWGDGTWAHGAEPPAKTYWFGGVYPVVCTATDLLTGESQTEQVSFTGLGPPCAGDVNGDGTVDVDDLVRVILDWGTGAQASDLNGDGIVDVDDLVLVITGWGPC